MEAKAGEAKPSSDETLVAATAPAAPASSSTPGIQAAVSVSDWKKAWFIGSPELGTNYSGSELIKGVMRLIRKTAAENLPDAFVMADGGVAPSMPSYGTKGGIDELRAIEKGIDILLSENNGRNMKEMTAEELSILEMRNMAFRKKLVGFVEQLVEARKVSEMMADSLFNVEYRITGRINSDEIETAIDGLLPQSK